MNTGHLKIVEEVDVESIEIENKRNIHDKYAETPTFSDKVQQIKRDNDDHEEKKETRKQKQASVAKQTTTVHDYNYDRVLQAVLKLILGLYLSARSLKAEKDDEDTN